MDMKKFSDQTGSLPEFAGVVAAAVVCGIALFAHARTTAHANPAAHTAAVSNAAADAGSSSPCASAGADCR
jgi:hypothetical protein